MAKLFLKIIFNLLNLKGCEKMSFGRTQFDFFNIVLSDRVNLNCLFSVKASPGGVGGRVSAATNTEKTQATARRLKPKVRI